MSRLAERFARLRAAGRKALIPYVTAGDPAPAITVPLMQAMAAAGGDVIELGVPFSDPMADGPVIQRASERALRHQMLDLVLIIRSNALETADRDRFFLNAAASASRFAGAVACAAQDAGKHVRIPVDHVCTGVIARGYAADILGHRRVRGTSVLAIDDLMKVFRIGYICWFQVDRSPS